LRTLKKILVIDDDEDVLKIVQYCLASISQVELKCALSGEEGIQAALEMEPDLILLDMMMPTMDGMATLQAMQLIPKLQCIPVVFLTAKAQKKEIEQYMASGAVDVIVKPFDPLTLSQTVLQIWEKSQKAM
jgi:two-component system OmpR family response regulator